MTKPVTEGIDRDKANPGAEGLESVQGHNRAGAQVGLESAPRTRALKQFKPPESGELHDIGEASFGPPPPFARPSTARTIACKITNTGEYPWRAHASLLITARDNSMWIGTGWFIGPHTLMTAGHCRLHQEQRRPGPRRLGAEDQGDAGAQRRLRCPTAPSPAPTSGRSRAGPPTATRTYDYGAIILRRRLGDTIGWFGFGVFTDADAHGVGRQHLGLPRRQAVRRAVVRRRRIASVERQQGLLRHRHLRRPERQCRLPDRRTASGIGVADPRIRRRIDELGHPDQRQGARTHHVLDVLIALAVRCGKHARPLLRARATQ